MSIAERLRKNVDRGTTAYFVPGDLQAIDDFVEAVQASRLATEAILGLITPGTDAWAQCTPEGRCVVEKLDRLLELGGGK